MHKNTIAFVLVAAVGGFIGGFWFANSLNRSAGLAPTLATQPSNTSAATPGDDELTDAEITAKIAEADQNPNNFAFQRDLGISLYRYGAMKQRTDLLGHTQHIFQICSSITTRRGGQREHDNFCVLNSFGQAGGEKVPRVLRIFPQD